MAIYNGNRTWGHALVELRTKAGISRQQIADLMGCANSSIANYESGRTKISPKAYNILCKKLPGAKELTGAPIGKDGGRLGVSIKQPKNRKSPSKVKVMRAKVKRDPSLNVRAPKSQRAVKASTGKKYSHGLLVTIVGLFKERKALERFKGALAAAEAEAMTVPEFNALLNVAV